MIMITIMIICVFSLLSIMHKQEVALFIEEFCADIALLDLWLPIEQECRKLMVTRATTTTTCASEVARIRAMCEARRNDWRPLLRAFSMTTALSQQHVGSGASSSMMQYGWQMLFPGNNGARGTINDIAREMRENVKDAQWKECIKRAIWWARVISRKKGTNSYAFSFAILLMILARDPRNFTIAQLSAPIEYEPGCSRMFAQLRALGAPLDVARNIMYRAERCTSIHRARECIMSQTCYARLLERDINIDSLPGMDKNPSSTMLFGHTHGPMSKMDALEAINIWVIKCILEVPCARRPMILRANASSQQCDGANVCCPALHVCECICARGITSTRATLCALKCPELRETYVLLCLWRAIMGFSMSASSGLMLTSDCTDIYCFDEIKASSNGECVTVYANRAIFDAFICNDDHEHDRYCKTVRIWCARLIQLAREVTDMPEYTFAPCARVLQACAIRALHVCDVWNTVKIGTN